MGAQVLRAPSSWAPGPPATQSGDVRQVVMQAGRDQHSPSGDPPPTAEKSGEPAPAEGNVGDDAIDRLPAVVGYLLAACGQQAGRWHAVAGQVSVQAGGRGVARPPAVHHQNRPTGSGQHQGCGQAGRATSDDYQVVLTHTPKPGSAELLLFDLGVGVG